MWLCIFLHEFWRLIWTHTVEKSWTYAASVTMCQLSSAIYRCIQNHTVETSLTSVTDVTLLHMIKAIWGDIWKCTIDGEKTNKCSQCNFASHEVHDLRNHLKSHTSVMYVILHPLAQVDWGYIWQHTVE